jgi:hypothetical protein
MAIVLEECATEEESSVVRILWTTGLNAKDIHKDIFACLRLEVSVE